MKKPFVFCVLLLIALFSIVAEPSVHDIISEFPAEFLDAFLNGETIEFCDYEPVDKLAFDGTLGEAKIDRDIQLDDAFSVSLASFVPYPESWANLSFAEKKLNVINTLLKISTIKGITYISHSAGDKPKVLFEDSYVILNPKKNKAASDAYFTTTPEEYNYQIYARLKDSIFGANNYSINYDISSNEIFMTFTNLDDLKFMMFKGVSKNELDMCVDVVMTKEGLALFGMATIRGREPQMKTPVVTVDLPTAFLKRIVALKNWFVVELEK